MIQTIHKYAMPLLVLLVLLCPVGDLFGREPLVRNTPSRIPTEPGLIVKVRPGFLDRLSRDPAQSAKTVATRAAAQVAIWTESVGVTEALPLWSHSSGEATSAAGLSDHPGRRSFILRLEGSADPDEAVLRLNALPWVEYAEIDRLLDLHQAPDDPMFERQWHLNNTGQPYWAVVGILGPGNDTIAEATGTPGADVGFLAAYEHDGLKGDVLVAVLDTGIDPEHEDLRDRLAINALEIPDNGIDEDRNGFIDDVYGWDFSGDVVATPADIVADNDVADFLGHGTHVSGTIAATVGNGIGVAGVSETARILGVKIFPNSFFSVTARAVYYAVSRGARVFNMSWGGGFRSLALRDALAFAHARGVVLIASTGNSGREETFYPAGYPQTIAVGASHSRDGLARFSTYNEFIDVIAPGQQILSLRAAGTDLYEDLGEPDVYIINERYLLSSGTSMAAPHVAGAAAALLALAPGLSNERIREILRASAVDIIDPYGDGAELPGWDRFTGAGRIDLENAIALLPGVHAAITHPLPFDWLGDHVLIVGSVVGDGSPSYDLFFAPGHTPEPDDWTLITHGDRPVTNGELGTWESGGLNGPFTIRLDAGPDARFDLRVNLIQAPTARIDTPQPPDTVQLLSVITGSAAAPDFRSYQIDAVGPLPSETAHPVAFSTLARWSDTLALWRTDSLETGRYHLILSVTSGDGTVADTQLVAVADAFAAGWPVTLPAVAHFAVRTADIDGVGDDEIICPTARGLHVFRSDGTAYPGWPRHPDADFSATPAIADLDFDGKSEIIIADRSNMYVFAFIGEQYEGWPQPFDGIREIYGGSVPSVGNLDGRGPLEIIAIDRDGVIHVWNSDGSRYQPDSTDDFGAIDITHSRGNSLPSASVCDLNRDGRPELIVAGDGLHVYDGRSGLPFRGNLSTQIAAHYSVNGYVIGDFNDDGTREIAYAYGDADGVWQPVFLTIVDGHGQPLPGWPRAIPDSLHLSLLYSLSAGDINDDRIPELFLAPYSLGEGALYGFHADGTPVGSDSADGLLAIFPGSISAIGLVDIDRDDTPEIIVRSGQIFQGPDMITALEADGSVVPGFPLQFGFGSATVPATPIVGDLDRDGFADMVTIQSTDMVIAVWELGMPISATARPWPQFRGDHWNSSVVATPRYDVIYLIRMINEIFRGTPPLPPYEPVDLNCDRRRDVSDIVRLTDYLYRAGVEPCVR
jgi:subtilisin family serine protease